MEPSTYSKCENGLAKNRFQRALRAAAACSFVFLDPDNEIAWIVCDRPGLIATSLHYPRNFGRFMRVARRSCATSTQIAAAEGSTGISLISPRNSLNHSRLGGTRFNRGPTSFGPQVVAIFYLGPRRWLKGLGRGHSPGTRAVPVTA